MRFWPREELEAPFILLPAIAALIRLLLEIGKNGYRTPFYNYFDEHTWSKPCLIEHLFR